MTQSDDRSDINPARFYTAKLTYDAQSFGAVSLTGVASFKTAERRRLPEPRAIRDRRRRSAGHRVAIRFDPVDGSIWYTSEGDRSLGLDPFADSRNRLAQTFEALTSSISTRSV